MPDTQRAKIEVEYSPVFAGAYAAGNEKAAHAGPEYHPATPAPVTPGIPNNASPGNIPPVPDCTDSWFGNIIPAFGDADERFDDRDDNPETNDWTDERKGGAHIS